MRTTSATLVFISFIIISKTMGGTAVPDNSTKKALLEDHVLYSAKSEQEILSWAKGKEHFGAVA